MASSNWTDNGLLAPPSRRNNTPSATQHTIVIEPTPEYQRFYNQARLDIDRQRLQAHVENSLEPPQAQPMARSNTGSDSLPSPSTVYSHGGESNAPLSPDPNTESARAKPHRGKRRGPLDPETRVKTAFKRKFKLPCDFHRAKRTSCNCYDFSKLEEAYLQTSRARERDARASEGQSVNSFGELGTFGTGGAGDAALTAHPRYPSFDLPGSSTGQEPTPHMPPDLLPILNFNIDSQASVDEIRSAPRRERVLLPPAALMPTPEETPGEEIVLIGLSTPYRTRWECKYQCTQDDTRSLASTDACTWTGPFEQLCVHFRNEHTPFRDANVDKWSQCLECSASALEWVEVEERTCPDPNKCHPDSWRKWFFGVVPRQSGLNPRGLTVSEASGSRSSWFDPPWNMTTPGSNNTERTNFQYNSSTDQTSYYEQSSCGNENNEADGGEEKDDPYHDCGGLQNCCRYQSDATSIIRHSGIGSWLSLSRWQKGPCSAICDSHRHPRTASKPCRGLALPLLLLLIVFRVRGERELEGDLLAFLAGVYCLRWYLLLAILAPLAAWTAISSLRFRTEGGDALHVLVPAV
ncbi:hypothetical protein F5Y10DRAFT_94948 [Nemania abortiva]|nr:hypothetical protein F5Y10DRAFT_94948 [Nemania abortiva]